MLAQVAPRVGDIDGNAALILQAMQRAASSHCEMLVLPELILTGYPPEDLLLRSAFMDAVEHAIDRIIAASERVITVFGHPRRIERGLTNSASLVADGTLQGVYDKRALPNYGVFDERRYFIPGTGLDAFSIHDWRIGVGICEDLWSDSIAASRPDSNPLDVLINLNASPFHVDKQHEREALMQKRAIRFAVPVIYVNQTGGQDEVVFDGGSHAMDADGQILARAPLFETADVLVNITAGERGQILGMGSGLESFQGRGQAPALQRSGCRAAPCGLPTPSPSICSIPQPIEQIHQALVLGVRDYVHRNGVRQAVIGLSGGIDSAVVAVLACEALGAGNVLGVLMPSRFSSDHSVSDAEALAQNMGMETVTLPIEHPVAAVETLLAAPFEAWGKGMPDVTEENIQARMRGLLLMAISNKTGRMLFSTGNKSEMAVGYATLYGDMAGGFAILKDVYKTQVYALAEHLNSKRTVIPQHTMDKPPSAELRPDQQDSDSLPDYETLDAILQAYIELGQSVASIVARGFDLDDVHRMIRMLYQAEYKRRQAPPGVKITKKAFGRDRRYPITHGFCEWEEN